jgi:hypothetical protein
MNLDINERDIESKLCQTCAACCRITFKLRDTKLRYWWFLGQIGYNLVPAPAPGQGDCCDKKHNATVVMGYCKYLQIEHNPEPHEPAGFVVLCQLAQGTSCLAAAFREGRSPHKFRAMPGVHKSLQRMAYSDR